MSEYEIKRDINIALSQEIAACEPLPQEIQVPLSRFLQAAINRFQFFFDQVCAIEDIQTNLCGMWEVQLNYA